MTRALPPGLMLSPTVESSSTTPSTSDGLVPPNVSTPFATAILPIARLICMPTAPSPVGHDAVEVWLFHRSSVDGETSGALTKGFDRRCQFDLPSNAIFKMRSLAEAERQQFSTAFFAFWASSRIRPAMKWSSRWERQNLLSDTAESRCPLSGDPPRVFVPLINHSSDLHSTNRKMRRILLKLDLRHNWFGQEIRARFGRV